MIKLAVPTIRCGHCVAAITDALRELDARAVVEVDIVQRAVTVSTVAGANAVISSLEAAGYPASLAR